MSELLAAFDRFLFGRGGVPINGYDLLAMVITGVPVVFVLFRGIRWLARLGAAVMIPVTMAATAADRKRDEDFIKANTDRAREATISYFHGKATGDMTEFWKVTSEPQPVREPTPAGEIIVSSTAPILALVAVISGILAVAGLILYLLGLI